MNFAKRNTATARSSLLAAAMVTALAVTTLAAAPASASSAVTPTKALSVATSAAQSTGALEYVSAPAATSLAQALSGDLRSGVLRISGNNKVVGNGTPASCTFDALAKAVRSGGNVTFDCGPKTKHIYISRTLVTCNTHNCKHPWQGGNPVQQLTVDGGGKVVLGASKRRGIFYANTCEESFGWLSSSCQNETTPHITFRNIGFKHGNATNSPAGLASVGGGGGGGAIAMRGGQLTVNGAWFYGNKCRIQHSDAGGGAIRLVGQRVDATIKNSTFRKNYCANGGAISSLQAPMYVINSTLMGNSATGSGASSGQGGNGGAIYFDGRDQKVRVFGSKLENNKANEGGPGIFYVSNDRTGRLFIKDSKIRNNTGESFYTAPYRDIFYLGNGKMWIRRSVIE